ncbi:MAG: type IV pili methyl-accepting chemotaxis transducer N-terminal domain-containing protein [Opitutales bacterium]
MRKIALSLFAVITAFTGFEQTLVAETNYGTVINIAGRQRMLTQKMSKEILLASYNPDFADYYKSASQTALLFDATLDGLLNGNQQMGLPGTKSKTIVRQIDKISMIWQPFYEAVSAVAGSKSANPMAINLIVKNNVPLLKEMNKAVKLYEQEYSTGEGNTDPRFAVTINLAGKQRMLTQKMSKEFVLIAKGHDAEENQNNLKGTYQLFDQTLQGLKNGDETLNLDASINTPEIDAQLAKVQELWTAFKPSMEKAANEGTAAITLADVQQVADDNVPLLKEMNKAVKLFEVASRAELTASL